MPRTLSSHIRKYCLNDVEGTEIVGFELVSHEVHGLGRSRKLLNCSNEGFEEVSGLMDYTGKTGVSHLGLYSIEVYQPFRMLRLHLR